MPSERDIAVVLWLFVGLLVLLLWKASRAAFLDLVRVALKPKIVLPVLALATYISAVVWLAAQFDLWQPDLASDTVAWFVGPGLGLLYGAVRVSTGERSFGQLVLSSFGFAAVVEVCIGLYDFGILVEFFLLIPLVAVLGVVAAVANSRAEFEKIGRGVDWILAIFGLAFLVYVLIHLIGERATISSSDLLRSFLLPIWLVLAALPVLGVMSLVFGYWDAMTMAKDPEVGRKARLRLLSALLLEVRLNLHDLHHFRLPWSRRAQESQNLHDTRSVVREYLDYRQNGRDAITAEQSRLRELAGVVGTDDEGKQLDQREFRETKDALQTLWFAQIGWHRNDGHFREDLVSLFEDNFVRNGLPDPSGVIMEIAPDGQSWFAWRRTTSGWCLGIGMADGPTETEPAVEWLFAGPEPPSGLPGQDPAWGEPWGVDCPDW